MKQVTFRMPENLAYRLKLAAVRGGTTQTDLIITAVEKYLEYLAEPTAPEMQVVVDPIEEEA